MARLWRFDPNDLLVDMPKPAGYDGLLGRQKLAYKHGYLRDRFGSQNFIFAGFGNSSQTPPASNSIKVYTVYATFEVAHWPAHEVQKQQRLTMERIASLYPPPNAMGNNKRRFEESYDDDEHPVVHSSTGEVHASLAKRRRVEGKGRVRVQGDVDIAAYHADRSARAFQERSFLNERSSRATAGAATELGQHSTEDRIAAGYADARIGSDNAVEKVELGLEAGSSSLDPTQQLSSAKFVHQARKTSTINRDRHSWGWGKGVATMQGSAQALARDLQHPSAQMSVTDQAAALQAKKDKISPPLNRTRPMSKPSSDPPQPGQTTHWSQNHTAGFHDRFLKTTTEACSGVLYETHRRGIGAEIQAQRGYVEELLFTHIDSRSQSEDARKAMVTDTITQLLVSFEKKWTDYHPAVTVPAITNILDRQIAYLTLDVAINCEDVADLDEHSALKHITAVQKEAMSRQLIILRTMTESLRRKVQSRRLVVAPSQDQKSKLLSSTSSSLGQLPSMGNGSFKPAVKKPALVIDHVTGVASVVYTGDPAKDIGDRSVRDSQNNTRKQKQDTDIRSIRKGSKTVNAKEDTTMVIHPMISQSLKPRTTAHNGSRKLPSDTRDLFHEVRTGVESSCTLDPAKLVRTNSVQSSTTASPQAVTNPHALILRNGPPAPNDRGYMNVTEAFMAHGYYIVPEEERTEDLLRHRQATMQLLRECSPLRDAVSEPVDMNGFCNVTPAEFDGFGFEGELELPDDAAPGLHVNSRGLWKW